MTFSLFCCFEGNINPSRGGVGESDLAPIDFMGSAAESFMAMPKAMQAKLGEERRRRVEHQKSA
jgi:hypothetical protein